MSSNDAGLEHAGNKVTGRLARAYSEQRRSASLACVGGSTVYAGREARGRGKQGRAPRLALAPRDGEGSQARRRGATKGERERAGGGGVEEERSEI